MFNKHTLVRVVSILSLLVFLQVSPARANHLPALLTAAPDPNPPADPVKLIFIHHSTGENLLRDDYGRLGIALKNNNYFVSDTNYGWGPNGIGNRTDIPNWTEWFSSADTPTYMNALFSENNQHSSYTRLALDPGGPNTIILFKSCFPNSNLEGSPTDPPSPGGWLTVGHAKWVYNQILLYFGQHPEKLFVVVTAPPVQDDLHAANARAFNQWLMNDWLAGNGYALDNVAVFDFYNVLTGPNNHHRFINGAIEHVFTPGMNTEYYPSGDDHPSVAGSLKATGELVPLLNVFYNRWHASLAPQVLSINRAGANPTSDASVSFTVQFSQAVTGVDAGDFAVTTAGATLSGASISPTLSGSGNSYTISVDTGTGSGTIRLDLRDDDSILSADTSVPLGGAGPGNGDFLTGQPYVVRPSISTFYSLPRHDGRVLESSEASGAGGSINATAATLTVGDDAARRQYRAILSFSTGATLPDDAAITGVSLAFKRQAVRGGANPVTALQGFMVDIKKGTFGTAALQPGDFQAAASKSLGPFRPTPVAGWYSLDLPGAVGYINRAAAAAGLTQIRLRFKLDDNGNNLANLLNLYSGNATLDSRPQLIITYYIP